MDNTVQITVRLSRDEIAMDFDKFKSLMIIKESVAKNEAKSYAEQNGNKILELIETKEDLANLNYTYIYRVENE